MTERNIDTAIWGDSWFQELDAPQKLLFIYLWTNPRCSSAGIYEISVKTVAFDTGLLPDNVSFLLASLAPKVQWYPEISIVWVKNFLRRQARSPQFLVAVAKSLRHLPPDMVSEYLEYNNTLSIPYAVGINTLSIPPLRVPALDQPKALSLKPKDQPEKSAAAPSHTPTFGECQNVRLSEPECAKLRERFGDKGMEDWIQELSLAKASKGYKSKSDYATILAWERRRVKIKAKESTHERSNGNQQYPQRSSGIPGNRPAGAFADLD